MSGAGNKKNDASSDTVHVEFKDARRSFTLNGAYLESIRVNAAREGKEPVLIVNFRDAGVHAIVRIIPD